MAIDFGDQKGRKKLADCRTIIEKIRSLDDGQKELAIESLRAEYQVTSDYTIHYSNVRLVLSTFFISIAFYILYIYLKELKLPFLVAGGWFVMFFGYFVNVYLTKLMLSGLKQLTQVELILSSIPEKKTDVPAAHVDGIPKLINYFCIWVPRLSDKGPWREDLSYFYIFLVAIYLLGWLITLGILFQGLMVPSP